MAVAFVKNHTAATPIKAAGTTIAVNLSTIVPAGNTIIAGILFDNAAVASKPVVSSIGVAAGETASWVFLGAARSTSTSAGAFASGELWAIRTTVAWPVAGYTATLDSSTVMKATQALEFSGLFALTRSTAGTNYSTTTTAASATTTGTTPVIGDLAVGFMFQSNASSFGTSDTDTTGGSWSAGVSLGSTGSSAATNNFGLIQYKILTGANHQTYNAAAALTAGNGSIVTILQAYAPALVTQAAYRFYASGGSESAGTAIAAQDTAFAYDASPNDFFGQLRIRLQSTSAQAVASTEDWTLQVQESSGPWNNVVLGSGYVQPFPDSGTTDGQATTNKLTGGTGTFVAGKVSEDAVADDVGWGGNNFTELLYTLYADRTQMGNGFVLKFRVVPTSVDTTMTYSVTPTINVTKNAATISQAAYRFYADGTESGSTALAAQDTAYSPNLTTGDLNLGVRVRLQTTNNALNEIYFTYELQYDLNNAGVWKTPQVLIDAYTAQTTANALTTDIVRTAQSFIGNGNAMSKTRFMLWSNPLSGPTVTSKIYSDNAGKPGTVVASSTTTIPTSSLPTSAGTWFEFAFAPFTLANGTKYWAAIECTTIPGGESVIYGVAPTGAHSGEQYTYLVSFSDWLSTSNDVVFQVLGGDPHVAVYDSASLTNDAAISAARLTGGTGSMQVGRVSEDGVVDVTAAWGNNNFTEFLYSVTLKAAALAHNDIIKFRITRNGTTTGVTYTVTPTLNIVLVTGPSGSGTMTSTSSLTATGQRQALRSLTLNAVATLSAAETRKSFGTFSGALAYSDTFDRADTTEPVSAGVGLGANWIGEGYKISSNAALRTGSSPAAWYQTAAPNDQYVEVDLPSGSTSDSGCLVRGSTNNSITNGYGSCYVGMLDSSSGGAKAWIMKYTSGSFVGFLADVAITPITGAVTLRLTAVGSLLTLYRNGVQVATATDSAHTGQWIGMQEGGSTPQILAWRGGTFGVLTSTSSLSSTARRTAAFSAGTIGSTTSSLTLTSKRGGTSAIVLPSTSSVVGTGVRQSRSTAALVSTATLTVTGFGVRAGQGTALLTATGTLTATGKAQHLGSLLLTSTTALSITSRRQALSTASLSAAAMLTITSKRAALGSGTVGSTGSTVVTGRRTADRSAGSFGSTSTLTATARRTAARSLSLTSTSTLTAEGFRPPAADGVIDNFGATSSLSATGVRRSSGSILLGATSGFATQQKRESRSTAALTAVTALTSTSTRGSQGTATLGSSAALSTTARRVASHSLSMSASSHFVVAGNLMGLGSLTLSSVATLHGVGFRPMAFGGAAFLSATGSLTATGRGQRTGVATLHATSGFAPGVGARGGAGVGLPISASSSLSSVGTKHSLSSILLTASGDILATGAIFIPPHAEGDAALAATSSLVAHGRVPPANVGIILNDAYAIYLGTAKATKVYLGTVQVWPKE